MQGSFLGGKSELWRRHKEYICVARPQICLTLLKNLQNYSTSPVSSFMKYSKKKTHSKSFVEHQRQVDNLFIDLQLATRENQTVGSAPNTDWQQSAHPKMDPYNNPYNNFQHPGSFNPQVQPFRPATAAPAPPQRLAHKPSRGSNLRRQVTEQLVAPADVLDYDRPGKKFKDLTSKDLTSQGMDKRHPSSFQQLEKVPFPDLCRMEQLLTSYTAGRRNLCNSMTPQTNPAYSCGTD